MSASLHTDFDRVINPLDVLEQIIAGNEWVFERRSDEEMAAEAPGKWCDYGLHFSWSSEMSAMAFTCAFDLKVPAARRDEVAKLLARINEQLLVGHFDLWHADGSLLFRNSLLRSGNAEANDAQCEALIRFAVETCERYFPAVQFVVWAGRNAAEALEAAMIDTWGEA